MMPGITGADVIAALKKKFRLRTDAAIAAKIGMTTAGIQNWKNRSKLAARQMGELVHKASAARPFTPVRRASKACGKR